MELIALCAPWIHLALVASAIGLFVFKKWKVAIILLILTCIGSCYFRALPINVFHTNKLEGQALKVLSFNCNLSPKSESFEDRRERTIQLITRENPDLVFLTENYIENRDSIWYSISKVYPYRTLRYNIAGNCLYSKHPILKDTLFISKKASYGISESSINYNGTQVQVFGVHLSSNNYNKHMEYMTPDSVAGANQVKAYLRNVLAASMYRIEEARLIVSELQKVNDSSNIPCIVMGDFNDVSGSPTLNILEDAGFKDAWWKAGFGYGATIHNPLPYRIDHILYKGSIRANRIKNISLQKLSDHNALYAEFSIID